VTWEGQTQSAKYAEAIALAITSSNEDQERFLLPFCYKKMCLFVRRKRLLGLTRAGGRRISNIGLHPSDTTYDA
jgi:hypothetical protein